jgi:uncharacterized protein (TIGR02145 family)
MMNARFVIKSILFFIFLIVLSPIVKGQCPTIVGSVSNVSCFGGNNGSITLTVSGDTASISNPGLLISEILTDPPLADSPKEWVELIATKAVDFSQTPYTIIFSNNGTATSKGWVEGGIPSPPPRNSTYAFQINTGTVQPGTIVYVGGTSMDPTGIKLRVKNTSTEVGDGGIGGAFTGAAGVLGNGGGIADGIAVFSLPIAQIDSNSIPVDAIFFGTSIGDAAMADTTKGFRLPVNDRYAGGRLKATSYLAPEILGSYSLQANGAYNRSNGVYTTPRTWSTNTTAWSSSTSGVSVSGYSYLWSNGATTKNISGLTAGTYTVTLTAGGCTVNATYTIVQNSQISIALNPGSVICNGTSTGAITSNVSGGTAPYTYLWSNNSTSSTINSLSAGNYTLTVSDAVGCSSTSSTSVTQSAPILVSSIVPNSNSVGYPVQLIGSGLSTINLVRFNGVSANNFTNSGDTIITVTVPQNANSGTVQLTTSTGCNYQSTAVFNYLYSSPDLTVKLYIEGLHVGNGYMEVPLVNSGLSGNALASDSVTIQLAEADAPNEIVFAKKALLQTTGISFVALSGDYIGKSYYIIIKHRSSLETWSKGPIVFSANTYFNFASTKQFPTVITTTISSILNTTALIGGNVTTDGGAPITARGVVCSTNPGPTVALSTKTINGTGLGTFTATLTGLTANTTYYIRAYATNNVGTAYGNEISFATNNYPVDINGNEYETIIIGTQTWFAKNLKVANYRNGDLIPTGLSNTTWQSATSGAYAIYNNQTVNDSIYGKLYNWYAVADHRGLCPAGWHVPSDAEFTTLENFLGGSSVAGGKMKEVGLTHWASPNTAATNSSGFTGLPGGYRDVTGTCYAVGSLGDWWSATHYSMASAYSRNLFYSSSNVNRNLAIKSPGFSVRCVKDLLSTLTTSSVTNINNNSATCGGNISSAGGDTVTARGVVWSTIPNPTVALTTKTANGGGIGSFTSNITGLTANTTYYLRAYATNISGTAYGNEVSFTTTNYPVDINGNVYDTVIIGTQIWMKQNLKVSKYRNGDSIPTGLSNTSWQLATSGAYTIYNNQASNDSIYGKLYNWYAVADQRGLCPAGWHVPSDVEWTILTNFLGGGSIAGGKMKEVGLTHCATPNIGATNSSGFTGLPGGSRGYDGPYYLIGYYGWWWSATQYSAALAYLRSLKCGNSVVDIIATEKPSGFSVRCVRDLLSTLTTSSVSDLTNTSATCGGNITSGGGDTVTARGVVWSTSPNPTIALTTKTNNGSGIGSFSSIITGLTVNTTYYVRAYATNISGTAYGNEVSFTTTNYPMDINGNVYDTVIIGTQIWMKQNLKVSKYRNGDPIPTGLTNAQWGATTIGAFTIYINQTVNDSIYGKLYNWYAVADPRGLCPANWHVPSDAEFTTLENFLGGSSVAGGKMKEVGLTRWASPNTAATNSSGFTGLPGGDRGLNGSYSFGSYGGWWSATQGSTTVAYGRYLIYNDSGVYRFNNNNPYGFSVRCVRD